MGLSIRTTPAQLDIRTNPGNLEYKTRKAQLNIRQKQPLIKIKTEQPMVLIDQYRCFAEEGLKNNTDFIKEQAQKGYQNLVRYIGKEARDGDSMARIGHHANIMINIAKNESIKRHEFGMGVIPKSRPQISVKGGSVDLQPEFRNNVGEINGVTASYATGDIKFKYTPANVDVRMRSYGSINITYTGETVDQFV